MVPALGSQRSAVHVETAVPNYLEFREVLQYHTEGDTEVLKEEAPAEDDFPRQVLKCLVQFMFSKIIAEHRAKRK